MTAAFALPLVLVIAFAIVAWRSWRNRRARELAARRARWGRPEERPRNLEAIARYHQMRASTGAGSLDARTWIDLDLDAVFTHVDRTSSGLGAQALYHRLRSAPVAAHLPVFDAMVDRFQRDAAVRENAQAALERLRDPAVLDVWQLTQPDALPDEPWQVILPVIAGVMALLLLASAAWPILLAVVTVGTLVNLLVRVWMAPRVGAVLAAFRQLAPVLSAAESLRAQVEPAWAPLVGALAADLDGVAPLRELARWTGRDTLATDPITQAIFGYLNLLFLVDANALYFGARRLRTHADGLRRVIDAMGEIDAAIAVASLRAGSGGWCTPAFTDPGSPVVLQDLRHPLVPEAVPNSISLGPPHALLVTGSNMAGKSTFIRTVGVTTILAQTLFTCFARRYAAPVLAVRSALRVDDDLLTGRSYYLVEVETVVALVHAAQSTAPQLFLLDELFRGTNAVERIAAAEAVLRALVEPRGGRSTHFVLAATHDGELAGLLSGVYETVHFADSLAASGLVFDYRLRPGPTSTRNAIALLRLEGAPATLVDRALTRAAAIDRARRAEAEKH